MEATCPYCRARLSVPAPGAYACGSCGRRVDLLPEPGAATAGPAEAAPGEYEGPGMGVPGPASPEAGAFGLEPPSAPPPGAAPLSAPAPAGFGPAPAPAAHPPGTGPLPWLPTEAGAPNPGMPPSGSIPGWAAQGPLPGAIGVPGGFPPAAPGAAPAAFGGGNVPGVSSAPPFGAPTPERIPAPLLDPQQQAPCAYHPGNAAVGVCERCGDFMCQLCTTTVEGRHYCPRCFDLLYSRGSLQFAQRQFTLPIVTLGLGIGALLSSFICLCFLSIPVGIGGVWTGVSALKQYAERPDLPNRVVNMTGLVLSILGILVGLGEVGFFVYSVMNSGH